MIFICQAQNRDGIKVMGFSSPSLFCPAQFCIREAQPSSKPLLANNSESSRRRAHGLVMNIRGSLLSRESLFSKINTIIEEYVVKK